MYIFSSHKRTQTHAYMPCRTQIYVRRHVSRNAAGGPRRENVHGDMIRQAPEPKYKNEKDGPNDDGTERFYRHDDTSLEHGDHCRTQHSFHMGFFRCKGSVP